MLRNKVCLWLITVLFMILSPACSKELSKSRSADDTILFPPPPDSARIQFLLSISSSEDIEGRQSHFNRFLFGPASPKNIVKPYGLTTKGSKIYVCDTGLGGLIIIDLEKKTFTPFTPDGRGKLKLPLNCGIDDRNYIYIADGNRKQVVIFNEKGNYYDAIGGGENFKPTDVKISASSIFTTSLPEHCIKVYSRDSLKLISSFPLSRPGDPSYLYQPTNIFLTDSEIYVSDMGDYKIKIFTHDGKFERAVGSYGNKSGQLTRPKGIAVDSLSNLYVVDAAFENVQIFDKKGNLLMHFGGPYNRKGDMWLPAGITLDYHNSGLFKDLADRDFNLLYLILVANQYGPDKIGVYGFVKEKKPK